MGWIMGWIRSANGFIYPTYFSSASWIRSATDLFILFLSLQLDQICEQNFFILLLCTSLIRSPNGFLYSTPQPLAESDLRKGFLYPTPLPQAGSDLRTEFLYPTPLPKAGSDLRTGFLYPYSSAAFPKATNNLESFPSHKPLTLWV